MRTINTTKVMRRVYMIWFARKFFNPFTLKAVAAIFLLGWLREYVSLKAVLFNSPSFTDPAATVKFFSYAFWNTTFVVEVLTVALIALGIFLFRDAIRRFSMADEYKALVGA